MFTRSKKPKAAKQVETAEKAVEPSAPVSPDFSREGVLLNPSHFTVSPEGLLIPKPVASQA